MLNLVHANIKPRGDMPSQEGEVTTLCVSTTFLRERTSGQGLFAYADGSCESRINQIRVYTCKVNARKTCSMPNLQNFVALKIICDCIIKILIHINNHFAPFYNLITLVFRILHNI